MRVGIIVRAACLIFPVSFSPVTALAQHTSLAACAAQAGGESAISEIVDAQTLHLADGRFVRLANLYLPPAASGARAFDATAQAVRLLKGLALGRKVIVRYGGRERDRYGVYLAHVILADEDIWLQSRLIQSGLALYASTLDNRACAQELLGAEDIAAKAKMGLWNSGFFHIADAADAKLLRDAIGTFRIVRGKVASVSERGSGAYLDFGPNWRRDFSVRLTPNAIKLMKISGRKAADYSGRSVRVRGWLRWSRGPLIEADHPEQIEIEDGSLK
jgi:endonuclease YncB( thermonuclease family)